MKTVFNLLNNAAFMSVVGLVLGGVITFMSGFIQAVYSNRHAEKMRRLEIQHKQITELYEKKRYVYTNFLTLRALFLNLQSIQNDATTDDTAKKQAASLFAEDFRKFISDSPKMFAEMSLYDDLGIAEKCADFSYKYITFKNEQLEELDADLSAIILLMRQDLSQTKDIMTSHKKSKRGKCA